MANVGDIVHFFPSEHEGFEPNDFGPYAAIVARVHANDPKYTTLLVIEPSGRLRPTAGVPHRSLFPQLAHDDSWEGHAHPSASHWRDK